MDLLTYIADMPRRQALATALNTSPDYLWQMATGWRKKKVSPEMAIAIERATNRAVRCADMRPDLDWTYRADGSIGYTVMVPAPVSQDAA